MYSKYRNSTARHKYEIETKTQVTNLRKVDNFIKTENRTTRSRTRGANNTTIGNETMVDQLLEKIADPTSILKK